MKRLIDNTNAPYDISKYVRIGFIRKKWPSLPAPVCKSVAEDTVVLGSSKDVKIKT